MPRQIPTYFQKYLQGQQSQPENFLTNNVGYLYIYEQTYKPGAISHSL